MDTLTQDILMEIDEKIDALRLEKKALKDKRDKLSRLYTDISTYETLLQGMNSNPTFKLVTKNSKFVMNNNEESYSTFKAFIISALKDYINKRNVEIGEVDNGEA